MRAMIALAALLLLTAATADAQCEYVQPVRFIKCPTSIEEICYIDLTVSSMESLTAYNYTNNTINDGAWQVKVSEDGELVFLSDSLAPDCSKELPLLQPIVADGTTRRNLLVVNDQLPGPTIIGYKNQRIRINVTNNLGKEAITLHWHGQHVNGSSGSQNQYSDGVPFVTQCPILPGNSFVYDYRFYPAGTYWYHSHQYDERSNGMYGSLVILDPDEDNTDYDMDIPEEHTIAFFEWFPVNSDCWIEAPYPLTDLVNTTMAYEAVPTNDGTEAAFPPFFAGFMNYGGWRYNPSATDCTRAANNSLPFFNVSSGVRYRFRLVGAQVNYAYRFSIAKHPLRVIATDGVDASLPNSATVDYIIVHVGERYDFVLDASESVDNYLMLFETLEDVSVLEQRGYCLKAHRGYAVLHYDGASDTLPPDFDDSYDPLTRCNVSNRCSALNCPFESYPTDFGIDCVDVLDLELASREPVPDNDVNPTVFINFGFNRGPSINDRVMQFPQSPPLSQLEDIPPENFCEVTVLQVGLGATSTVEGGSDNGTIVPTTLEPQPPFNCIHTYTATTETVEMVFSNLGLPDDIRNGASHPIHLHGHHYFVMDIGYPLYFPDGTVNSSNPDINCTADGGICNVGAEWANGGPPPSPCEATNTCPLKDTVIVPIGGYVRIRFPRNNWGWWIMHCHIEPHLLGGMAMVVNETSVPGDFPVPNGFPTCANFNNNAGPQPVNPEIRMLEIAVGVLAALCILFLILLIAVVIALIVTCCCKCKKRPAGKVEVELK